MNIMKGFSTNFFITFSNVALGLIVMDLCLTKYILLCFYLTNYETI